MCQIKIPRIWSRVLIVAIPKSYWGTQRAIALYLYCVFLQDPRDTHLRSCRTTHRPTCACGNKWDFDTGGRTLTKVTLLTQDRDDSFSAKKKTEAVFVDLTTTYDTGWHRSLTCKLPRLLPDRHMVRMNMELVGNSSCTVTNGKNTRSRLGRFKNASRIESNRDLTPLFFNITPLPCQPPLSEYARADDLAIVHADEDWQAVEGVLSKDKATCKLLQLLLDRHMVRMIMEMVWNRSFTLNNGNGKRSRLLRLKNIVPQGSVLAPLTSTSLPCQPPSTESMQMLTV